VEKNQQKEDASETPKVEVLEKAIADAKIKHHKKDTKPAAASLEAHQATSSSSDVSVSYSHPSKCTVMSLLSLLFLLAFDAYVPVYWHRVS
jgi:hypothetical protein